jgi:hypothetical protein
MNTSIYSQKKSGSAYYPLSLNQINSLTLFKKTNLSAPPAQAYFFFKPFLSFTIFIFIFLPRETVQLNLGTEIVQKIFYYFFKKTNNSKKYMKKKHSLN